MIELIRETHIDDSLFFLFLAGVVVVALLKYVYPHLFLRDTLTLFRKSESSDASSYHATKGEKTYQVISSLLFAYVITIAVFMWYDVNDVSYVFDIRDVFLLYGVAVAFIAVKYVLDKSLMWLFGMEDMCAAVMERVVSRRLFIAVWAGGLFFVVWYATGGVSMVFGMGEILVFLAGYVLLYMLSMAEFLLKGLAYFLFFIFYLCTVEICPAILGWIWIKTILTH